MTASQLLADIMENKTGYMCYSVIERKGAQEACRHLVSLKILRYVDMTEDGLHVAINRNGHVPEFAYLNFKEQAK